MALPLIDLTRGSPAEQAALIDAALRQAGFFAITDHGVDEALRSAAFDAAHRFFALPQGDQGSAGMSTAGR
jgi:isopenicillin N synthase-like dioxygenase